MDGAVNKLLAGLAVGFVVMGSGCIKEGAEWDYSWRCCTSTVLVFERTGGPDFDAAPWGITLAPRDGATSCVFGTTGWQCDNPDFVGVPPPPATRGMPRSTELRLRMWAYQGAEVVGAAIRITASRAFVPLPDSIGVVVKPVCTLDDDAPRIPVVLPTPVEGSGT